MIIPKKFTENLVKLTKLYFDYGNKMNLKFGYLFVNNCHT